MQTQAINPFAVRQNSIQENWISEPGRVCVLTFDKPNCSANTLDRATLEELEIRITEIEADREVRGLVFISAKESIFLAGADLELLAKGPDHPELLAEYIGLGQRVFNRIAALKIPTVAAIHGACVGGGYELALACDYRVATPDKCTKIGLPETKLGILPAWGGSSRLPRLIGIPKAIDIIVGGKTPHSEKALRLGMVDKIVPREWLLPAALKIVAKHRKRHLPTWRGWENRIVATVVGGKARSETLHRTRGHYPAAVAALDVILEGAGAGLGDIAPSLARERTAVEKLAANPECRNLFHLFLLQEQARKAGKDATKGVPPVERVAVIGAGIMGAGIAQWLSARGIKVLLRDIDAERVGAGMGRIFTTYAGAVKRRLISPREARDGVDRISPVAYEAPLKGVEWVIEAAVEKLTIKETLFKALDAQAPAEALLATNTSALPVAKIARNTSRPSRVIGLHFFNPVHRMPLVEVVMPEGVERNALKRAVALVQQIGKTPVVVRDTPGFLVNRVLLPYLMQAALAFDGGAGVQAIDTTMLDFGMPMGPLRLADEVGLDVALEVATTLATAYPDRMSVPAFLGEMVKAGLLGKKTGRGFYEYPDGKDAPRANRGAEHFRSGGTAPDVETLRDRMVFKMLDEAARCLDEKVVATPGDVDLGMVLGAGFPPFRGGPLRYVDSLGAEVVVARMSALLMEPCAKLREMASKNLKFYENAAD